MTITHTAQHTSTRADLISRTADMMLIHNLPAQTAMSWVLDDSRSPDAFEELYCSVTPLALRMMHAASKRLARGTQYSRKPRNRVLKARTPMIRCAA